jgi:hypothetical protein
LSKQWTACSGTPPRLTAEECSSLNEREAGRYGCA